MWLSSKTSQYFFLCESLSVKIKIICIKRSSFHILLIRISSIYFSLCAVRPLIIVSEENLSRTVGLKIFILGWSNRWTQATNRLKSPGTHFHYTWIQETMLSTSVAGENFLFFVQTWLMFVGRELSQESLPEQTVCELRSISTGS